MKQLFIAAALTLALVGTAWAQSCYETTIQSPTPFLGNSGEIIKLADGSLWEIMYAYNYLYAYYPPVIVCPDRGKLIVNDKSIAVQLLRAPTVRQ